MVKKVNMLEFWRVILDQMQKIGYIGFDQILMKHRVKNPLQNDISLKGQIIHESHL